MSNLEHLANLRRSTGLVVRLRPYENVLKVMVTETKAAILVETFRYKETAREISFNERGQRLMSFALGPTGSFMPEGEMITWDQSFVPFVHVKFGKSVSPQEYAAQREWERQTYRPGNDRTPLDSYSRVCEGYTTDSMERHW